MIKCTIETNRYCIPLASNQSVYPYYILPQKKNVQGNKFVGFLILLVGDISSYLPHTI